MMYLTMLCAVKYVVIAPAAVQTARYILCLVFLFLYAAPREGRVDGNPCYIQLLHH